MDADRFDALLRSWSATPSRRTALGVLAGSVLGRLSVTDAEAHNSLQKCKKIGDEDRRNRCEKKARRHKRQHRNAAPTCPPLCPVCQSCDPASGQCVSGNHSGVCGIQSVPRGGVIRCCGGTCPDPECRPAGDTGIACVTPADCVGINCCAQQRAVFCSSTCICLGAVAGAACGSDRDCEAAAPATACICGTCQEPPA
jgi:hypothetical protein